LCISDLDIYIVRIFSFSVRCNSILAIVETIRSDASQKWRP